MNINARALSILGVCIALVATGGCSTKKTDSTAIVKAAEAPACASASMNCQELAGYYPSIKTVSGTEAIVAFYKTHDDAINGEPPAAAATVVLNAQGNWVPK